MSLADKISKFNRERKWDLFLNYFAITPQTTILDVGFTENEYSKTDNFLEKNYPYPKNITALGIDKANKFLKRYPDVKVIKYNGTKFPFIDKQFDICWSNAVIEHVGDKAKQLVFIKEITRVSKSSFFTTPNKWFPVEVHTRTPLLHFLPKALFHRYLHLIGKEWAAGDYMNLLSVRDLKKILKKAEINDFKIIKNKLFIMNLDFIVMIFNKNV